MTATEELRRLLDERGIEHVDFNMPDKFLTMFGGGEHDGAYTENSVDTILTVCGASPEQAVEATLGRGTCHETIIDHHWRGCCSCGYIWEFMYGIGKCERPHYCPNCGRRIVEVDE